MIRPLIFAAVLLAAPTAFAEEAGRYQLQAVEGGIVRLDTRTGQMDFCRATGQGLACETAMAAPAPRAATPADADAMRAQLREGTKTMEMVMPELMRMMSQMRATMEREAQKESRATR